MLVDSTTGLVVGALYWRKPTLPPKTPRGAMVMDGVVNCELGIQ